MYIVVTGIHYRILIANCYLAEREKRGEFKKKVRVAPVHKNCNHIAIEPDISDEVPALAIQKNEREVLILWTRLKFQ